MTATELLRKLLDERGVEWSEGSQEPSFVTSWHMREGHLVKADWMGGDVFALTLYGQTPAQAIAATLGAPTLTAESDRLREALDALEAGTMYAKYREVCDERDRLQRVVRTQADSFKDMEREIAVLKADSAKLGQ